MHYSTQIGSHDGLAPPDGLLKAEAAVATWQGYDDLEFIAFGGDLIEGNPTNETIHFEDIAGINAVFEDVGVPVHYCLGNHDFDGLSHADVLGALDMAEGYYSFDAGGLHFVVLDGNYEADDDSSAYNDGAFDLESTYINPTQRAWLTADLAGTELATVIFIHQRLDGTGAAYVDNAADVRAILESSAKVPLVIQGHQHDNAHNLINGIHYVTMMAMTVGGFPTNAYAAISIGSALIRIRSFGSQLGRLLARFV